MNHEIVGENTNLKAEIGEESSKLEETKIKLQEVSHQNEQLKVRTETLEI